MASGSGVWSAVGELGAAGLSALGLVVAGVVAARATASASRTSSEAQEAVRTARAKQIEDLEQLVRALARSYDELRLWVLNPAGPAPEPNARVRRFYETGA